LAQDLLQAFVIGAGWTGLIGSYGLRTDYAQRKSRKDQALNEVVGELEKELRSQLQDLFDAVDSEGQIETQKRQREITRLQNLVRRAELARGL
jgi:hypothetical protein